MKPSNNYVVKLFLVLALLIFALDIVNVFFIQEEQLKTIIGDFVPIIMAVFAIILSILAYKKIGKTFFEEKVFWMAIIGVLVLRLAGEGFWAFYELILEIDAPTPSLADGFWHLSYLSIVIALYYKYKVTRFEQKRAVLSGALVLCTLVAFLLYMLQKGSFVLEDAITYQLNFSYLVWDIYILGLVFVISYPVIVGYSRLARYNLMVWLSFVSFAIFDYFFAQGIILDTYETGAFIDLFYDFGYVLLAYAAYLKTVATGAFTK